MTETDRLDGQVVVVTGATSGIGRAIALRVAAAGAKIVLVGRDAPRLAESTARARELGDARSVRVDLGDPEAPETITDVARSLGPWNGIVHAAGIMRTAAFVSAPLADLDEQWRVNVRAPFSLTRAAVPHLARPGSVIFISSNAGRRGFPGGVGYSATKGAIEAMTRSLAAELGPDGIRVNCIAPGAVRTEMNARLRAERPAVEHTIAERTPLRRWGEPSDIAPAVLYLLSQASSFVTGATLAVDGGSTIVS